MYGSNTNEAKKRENITPVFAYDYSCYVSFKKKKKERIFFFVNKHP